MNTNTRDAIRSAVIDKLLETFPKAQKVCGGVAFRTETLDEDTGLFHCVELKVSVPNTGSTSRSDGYDLEEQVAKYNNRPGRRVADPEKMAMREALAQEVAARRIHNTEILRDFFTNEMPGRDGLTAKDLYDEVKDRLDKKTTTMNLPSLLKDLIEEGLVVVGIDKRKKIYSSSK